MTNYQALIIVLSSVGVMLLLVPVAAQISNAHRVPFLSLFFWIFVQNVQNIVNASIWGGTHFYDSWDGAGYCDVMAYVNDGTSAGISCCIAAISFFLFSTLRMSRFVQWPTWKQNVAYCSICWGPPALNMALAYLVMARRYSILRWDGCSATHSTTYVTTLVICGIPLLCAACAMAFSSLTILAYLARRKDTKDILYCTNSGMSVARFARTLAFCVLSVCIEIALNVVLIIANHGGARGYSFKETHDKVAYSIVFFLRGKKPMYSRWVYVAFAYLSFLLFGTGNNTKPIYRYLLQYTGIKFVTRRLGKAPRSEAASASGLLTATSASSANTVFQEISDEESATGKTGSQKTRPQMAQVFGSGHAADQV